MNNKKKQADDGTANTVRAIERTTANFFANIL